MKRALMLLLTLALLGVAAMVPAAATGQTCTCAEEQTACTTQCQQNLCRKAILRCNASDPCDATCTCGVCAP